MSRSADRAKAAIGAIRNYWLPWVTAPLRSTGLILMYHRVADLASDPNLIAVTPDHFAEHLELVCKYGRPLPLIDLTDALVAGRLPRRWVAVTLDDGYADNLYNAKPLLERFDVPATVFVTTRLLGLQREFWWDELERLLLQPGTLPNAIELHLDGQTWQWTLGQGATYSEADHERHRGWHIERPDDPTPRQRLYRSLFGVLHTLRADAREQLLDQARRWADAGPEGRPSHRTLSQDELTRLAEGDLIEIGAHTVTHTQLAILPIDLQRDEIRQSRARLEALLNRRIRFLAYPHGSYTRETLAIVREAGFAAACSSDTAAVRRNADWLRLPRMSVWDWDGDHFGRLLRTWFRILR